MRGKIIKLTTTAAGIPTEYDGKYVREYDPTYVDPHFGYDGGILEVTDNPTEALVFPDATAALEKWRQSYGVREDGEPNRPLTAWTVEIVDALDD